MTTWSFFILLLALLTADQNDTDVSEAETVVSLQNTNDTNTCAGEAGKENLCCQDGAQRCVHAWVQDGCLWDMDANCTQYDKCATNALSANRCGVDCDSKDALACGDDWVQMGCSVPGQQIPMDFIMKCQKFTPCVRLYGREFNDCLAKCEEPGSRECFEPCMEQSIGDATADAEVLSFSSKFGVCLGMLAVYKELCSSASTCVDQWVAGGCNMDDFIDARLEPTSFGRQCRQFELCAYGARDEGRCDDIDQRTVSTSKIRSEAAAMEIDSPDLDNSPDQREPNTNATDVGYSSTTLDNSANGISQPPPNGNPDTPPYELEDEIEEEEIIDAEESTSQVAMTILATAATVMLLIV